MGMKLKSIAALGALLLSTSAGMAPAVATTLNSIGAYTEQIVTATDTFTTAPSTTDWVCFKDTKVIIQETTNQASGLAIFLPLVERSDTNPAVTPNPAQATIVGGMGPVGGPAQSILFDEPGIGWWRVRLTAVQTTPSYQAYGALSSATGYPISISLSGKSC